ncbi:MAG: efflux RND transporter permease subunit, partial [Dehalococcoidia bacterium]
RFSTASVATREVGAAIVSSTLTTVVVFIPLAFIQGLVGEFFTPFAMSVSFALLASTLVALTAVPVLGALLLRQGDFPDEGGAVDIGGDRETWLQRMYRPALVWGLRHKFATILLALLVTFASLFLTPLPSNMVPALKELGLTGVIPVTFFPAGTPEYLTIDLELPIGTSVGHTFAESAKVERILESFKEQGYVEGYQVSLGGSTIEFGSSANGMNVAGIVIRLTEEVPPDITEQIRAQMPVSEGVDITVQEITSGPPADGLEINIVGNNFSSVSAVAKELVSELKTIDEIINVSSDVSDARDEVTINVNPQEAAEFGLTTAAVGQQVNQFIVGRAVTEVDLDEVTLDVVVRGRQDYVDDIEKLKALNIQGPLGIVKLGSISEIAIEQGPVSVSRFDLERSAAITGTIVAEDTQAVGGLVQAKIDALDLPPGVEVRTGGIFEQIQEGFQDIFAAMIIGVVLVYLVMVASLGSLRNPFIIVLSLPLAIVGALVALAVTDRSLSLSALMGLLLLIGVVVTNAIVLITFVEQLREQGMGVYDALLQGGLVRLRPILMTAFTTTFALFPLAVSSDSDSGIIGAELATVVIGGLISSTFLTLMVVPVIYTIMHVSLPGMFALLGHLLAPRRTSAGEEVASGD